MRFAAIVGVVSLWLAVAACGAESSPPPPPPQKECDASLCVSPPDYDCDAKIMTITTSKAKPSDGLSISYAVVVRVDNEYVTTLFRFVGDASSAEEFPADVTGVVTITFVSPDNTETTRIFDYAEQCTN